MPYTDGLKQASITLDPLAALNADTDARGFGGRVNPFPEPSRGCASSREAIPRSRLGISLHRVPGGPQPRPCVPSKNGPVALGP